MKKISTLINSMLMAGLILIITNSAQAQVPQGMNYQAIVRDASGNPILNTNVCFRFTIHNGSGVGPIQYQETDAVLTNGFGLATVQVGMGTPVQGTFSAIPWSAGNQYLQAELDQSGACTTWVDMGASQLLTTPYAMYAAAAAGVPTVTGTLNYVGKFTPDNASIGNSLIFDNGTNVGIGTITPASPLDVNGQGHFLATVNSQGYSDATLQLESSALSFQYASIGMANDGGYTGVNLIATDPSNLLVMDTMGQNFANITALAFIPASDISLKKNINNITHNEYENYLNQIRNIESITYLYKSENSITGKAANIGRDRITPHVGFSAQSLPSSVQYLIPVSGAKNAEMKLGYNLSDMAGLTLVGVKALDSKVTDLEKVVNEQKQLIIEQRQMINQLNEKLDNLNKK